MDCENCLYGTEFNPPPCAPCLAKALGYMIATGGHMPLKGENWVSSKGLTLD